MPRLLAFVPCEKVIISGAEVGDGSASLISILQGIDVNVSEQAAGEKLAAPMTWYVFALWQMGPNDSGKSYEQYHEFVSPSGKVLFSVRTEFTPTKEYQRVISKIVGLPLSEDGEHRVVLKIGEPGKPDTQREVASYPLNIRHILAEQKK